MLHFFWTPYLFTQGLYDRYELANNEIVKYARKFFEKKVMTHITNFNCARGIVPLVTPESGFSCPYAIYLTQDPGSNRDIIQRAMAMPEDEYV